MPDNMDISVLEPVLTSLVEVGVFGNVYYLDLETDETVMGASSSSDFSFVTLRVQGPEGKEVLPLVVKLPVSDLYIRVSRNIDAMFHNEVTMYKEILPKLGVNKNVFPKMFYGLATNGVDPDKNLLVLENLKNKNFCPSKTKIFLDIDHISIAIKKIAEFHSFSFIHKHNDRDSFLQMTKKLKGIDLTTATEHEYEVINAASVERGIMPLIKDKVSIDLLTTCLSLLKYPLKTRDLISSPEEPFAIICHGDYCNNNILYKYDENERPIDCALIDFQFSKYGSPAIDIFFFLYMNTTSELREKYWDEILKLYWDTLRKFVPSLIAIPSFEDILKHFSERAIYGYTIASFFLPTMMANKPFYGNESQSLTIEENVGRVTTHGGEEAEQKLRDIVLHMLKKGYISAYIELCKNKNFKC